MYDPRETRHVVDINLGLLERRRRDARREPEFPIADVESEAARRASRADRRPLRAAQPGRGVAEQALAAGAARRAVAAALRGAARPDVGRAVGTRRGGAGGGGRRGGGRRRDALAADPHRRSRRARARRRADGVGRHRADAHRRRRRHADRRHLRPDASGAQRRRCRRTTSPCRATPSASATICGAAGSSACACSTSRSPKCSAAVERRLAAEPARV